MPKYRIKLDKAIKVGEDKVYHIIDLKSPVPLFPGMIISVPILDGERCCGFEIKEIHAVASSARKGIPTDSRLIKNIKTKIDSPILCTAEIIVV